MFQLVSLGEEHCLTLNKHFPDMLTVERYHDQSFLDDRTLFNLGILGDQSISQSTTLRDINNKIDKSDVFKEKKPNQSKRTHNLSDDLNMILYSRELGPDYALDGRLYGYMDSLEARMQPVKDIVKYQRFTNMRPTDLEFYDFYPLYALTFKSPVLKDTEMQAGFRFNDCQYEAHTDLSFNDDESNELYKYFTLGQRFILSFDDDTHQVNFVPTSAMDADQNGINTFMIVLLSEEEKAIRLRSQGLPVISEIMLNLEEANGETLNPAFRGFTPIDD